MNTRMSKSLDDVKSRTRSRSCLSAGQWVNVRHQMDICQDLLTVAYKYVGKGVILPGHSSVPVKCSPCGCKDEQVHENV